MDVKQLRIAIVCDWLKDWGGAEQVLYDMLEIIPHADIFCPTFDPKNFPELEGKVTTSFIQKIPILRNRPKLIPFLRTYAFESMDFSGYDLVISSSSAESKGIITGADTRHICYCHTPTRYYWSHTHHYQKNPEFGWLNPLARLFMPFMIHRLRMWDFLAAQRVDTFIANSQTTAKRIAKFYRRESEILNPGLDATSFVLKAEKKEYFLALGRMVPYKRFDLLVETFNRNGLPLKIVTSTRNDLQKELQGKSLANVEWVFDVTDNQKIELYQNARAFLFPPEEDFGMVPVEAMLCGTPVIAFGKAGALETALDGLTGVLFPEQTPESLQAAI